MSTQPTNLISPEEYLALERKSPVKHEYRRGEVFAMSRSGREHNLVRGNVVASLHGQLAERCFEAYASDMRVRILSAGVYVYPDVVVTCEKPQFEDAEVDTLVNPLVIIEVSSRSTESYDRGKKFGFCREIESLREYVLISQQSAHVERFFRGDDGVWRFNDANGLEAVMELPTIGCRIKLADVYAKVEFPPEDEINRAAGLFPSGETR